MQQLDIDHSVLDIGYSPRTLAKKCSREQIRGLSPYARLFLIEDAKSERPQDAKVKTPDR